MALRIIFAGTPEFAAQHLQTLLDSDQHEVVAVYTQPDRPANRGKKLTPSAVKQVAERAGLPVWQPVSLRDPQAQQQLAALQADIMVVVAYGLILPPPVLSAPRLGCINVHASLLPRWRGAAPIQRAIEAGDPETGVTIMQMDIGLDTGAMLTKARCSINADDTAASLHQRLAELGGPALLDALQQLECGRAQAQAQDDRQSCYADKISKQEAEIDWQQSAVTIERRIRAFNPFPVAYSTLDQQRIKIWAASVCAEQHPKPGQIVRADKHGIVVACGSQSLLLQRLQLPGGKALEVADLLNARADLFSPGKQMQRQ